jgi:benzoate membrane transport protein
VAASRYAVERACHDNRKAEYIMKLVKDFSASAVSAGFVTVVVGFTSSVVVVLQAAAALGATPAEVSSWMWALGFGMGLTSILMSLGYNAPIATAWSTAGAALLVTGAGGISMSEAVGAFLISGLLITACGFSGWFEKAIGTIPLSIGASMLSGILLRFGMDAFGAMRSEFLMTGSMFVAYLIARRRLPRYAIILTLAVGVGIAYSQGSLHFGGVHFGLAKPVFVLPEFSLRATLGVAVPLFVVTMVSQNVPAVAVLRSSGFAVPISPLIGWTGIATVILAPFGGYAFNLATITAAICTGREAHENPGRRYVAAVCAGVFYIATGVFGASIVALFAAFPRELVFAIAGFALIGTIGSALATAVLLENERESAIVTLLVTASGISLYGIGSTFWGIVAGTLALLISRVSPVSVAARIKKLALPTGRRRSRHRAHAVQSQRRAAPRRPQAEPQASRDRLDAESSSLGDTILH